MSATLETPAAAQPASAPAAAFGHRLAPPGDPFEGAEFDEIYRARIEPELLKREAERKGAVRLFFGAVAVGAALIVIEFLLTPVVTSGRSYIPPFVILMITAGAAGFVGYIPVAGVAARAKSGVINALCGPLGIAYKPVGGEAPSFDTFLKLNLLPRPSSKVVEDFFTGRRRDVDFALCEATLTQGEGKNRHTVFQGQLIRLAQTRRLASTTVVLRNTGWFSRFECPKGLEQVGLEDPKFNKIFAVFGSDQVEARVILTPSFMQQLVDLETGYNGKHLRCGFDQVELLVAVEGSDRFEMGNMFTSLVQRARVEKIARDIEQVFKLIDEFAAS